MEVNAYLSRELAFPEPGLATIGVVVQIEPDEPLLAREIASKVGAILEEKGYAVGEAEEAEYVLLCAAGMDPGETRVDYTPVYSGGGYYRTYYQRGRWRTRVVTTHLPGYTTYVPYTYTVYPSGLSATLMKKDLIRGAPEGEAEAEEEAGRPPDESLADATVWRCVTLSAGTTSDLRWIVNHMLLATFDRFGEDTSKQLRVAIPKDDERVTLLAEDGVYAPAD